MQVLRAQRVRRVLSVQPWPSPVALFAGPASSSALDEGAAERVDAQGEAEEGAWPSAAHVQLGQNQSASAAGTVPGSIFNNFKNSNLT